MMLHLTKGNIENIYLTLTEKVTLPIPNYLFVFTNRSSNLKVNFVLLNADDISIHKDRYNMFEIDVDEYFDISTTGVYEYEVYEQTSTSNINPNGLNLLENGIMMLKVATTIFTEYSTTDTYKIRQ
jgi:hypothetical protein